MNQKRSEKDETKQEIERVSEMAAGHRNLFSMEAVQSGKQPSLPSQPILPESATEAAQPEEESVASYYKTHPIASEYHHAAHALFLLFCVIRLTIKGEKVKRRTLGRIIHHLMDLREFIGDSALNELVNSLRESVQAEYDQTLGVLVRGIHRGLRAVMGSKVNSVLLALSEDKEEQPQIVFHDWLLANQDKVLGFARHYNKQHIFENLLPISPSGGSKHE